MIHSDRFNQIHDLLTQFESYWHLAPFYDLPLGWQASNPKLSNAVLGLNEEEFNFLDRNPRALAKYLTGYIPGYENLINLTRLTRSSNQVNFPSRWSSGVPGRKWSQIQKFSGALRPLIEPQVDTFVDWCAGKSYLGRSLAAHHDCKLIAIEKDAGLCRAGLVFNKPAASNTQFICSDVLLEPQTFHHNDYVIALHACGDLHRTLVRQWGESDSTQLALAPCCYHQWLNGGYQPLSKQGQENDIRFTKTQVRLAVQEMVTSPERTRTQTKTLNQWRLAFDVLQREVRGCDEYMPTPSLPHSTVNMGFQAFVKQVSNERGVELPANIDFRNYQRLGEQRFEQVQRLQLVNHGFSRAIELWMVLDLVLYLVEVGCSVSLAEFCDRSLTPRNLLISAWR